jgi:hypothetical protein
MNPHSVSGPNFLRAKGSWPFARVYPAVLRNKSGTVTGRERFAFCLNKNRAPSFSAHFVGRQAKTFDCKML